MKTIGQIIRSARIAKNYSFADLEGITRIKRNFIEAIEKEKWQALPPFPTVLGFVKSLAGVLELNERSVVAILRRDYPPKILVDINPKPDVSAKFLWSPKLTFSIGIAIVVLAILGYLGFQYKRFISPPFLRVDSPQENQQVVGESVLVFGSTDYDAKIVVNDQPVIVDQDGKFSVNLKVSRDTKEVDIIATSRSGKMTEVKRNIEVQ
jgi:cytoskeletal protein RodZ